MLACVDNRLNVITGVCTYAVCVCSCMRICQYGHVRIYVYGYICMCGRDLCEEFHSADPAHILDVFLAAL